MINENENMIFDFDVLGEALKFFLEMGFIVGTEKTPERFVFHLFGVITCEAKKLFVGTGYFAFFVGKKDRVGGGFKKFFHEFVFSEEVLFSRFVMADIGDNEHKTVIAEEAISGENRGYFVFNGNFYPLGIDEKSIFLIKGGDTTTFHKGKGIFYLIVKGVTDENNLMKGSADGF